MLRKITNSPFQDYTPPRKITESESFSGLLKPLSLSHTHGATANLLYIYITMQADTYKQHLTQLYGEPTQVSSRQLQRNYVKQAKLQNHLTFLKRCRDSSITPTGLQLKSSISTPRAKLIIHKAGQALVRERIANTRHQLHTMEQDIQTSKVNLSQLLEPADLRKCQAFNTSTAGKTFQSTRQKQIVKFNKLLANSQKSTNRLHQPARTPLSTSATIHSRKPNTKSYH